MGARRTVGRAVGLVCAAALVAGAAERSAAFDAGAASRSAPFDAGAAPAGEAFRDGMITPRWSSAIKQFFGTAYEAYDSSGAYSDASPTAPISRVWFTGGQGILTEVFWPSIDTPQVKDSQFLVSDGQSFFFEERRDSRTQVRWLQKGVPAFVVTNADPQGRFSIEKTIFADPDRDVVLQHVKITRNVPGLSFYYLHKPAVANSPMGNSARASLGMGRGASPGAVAGSRRDGLPAGLYAWQGAMAQAVVFSAPLRQVSAGFSGASDGWQDLHDHQRMDYRFETATQGNVALTAWLDLPQSAGTSELDVALGFGADVKSAAAAAQASLARGRAGVDAQLAKYAAQWNRYQQSVLDLSGVSADGGDLFRASVAVLKSSEDKTHAGAIVASPTVPWGNYVEDHNSSPSVNGSRSSETGGYHMVWPRDLYQMATTFLAIRDTASAVACLSFLRGAQFGPGAGSWEYGWRRHDKNGSFPQNAWTSGETFWSGLQMDEVAMPLVLAYRLWQAGAIDPAAYWDMVRRGADFIQELGPWSPMERWEEIYGASPSTIAAEITALWASALYAERMGDSDRASRYRATADAWASKPGDNVGSWLFTHSGSHGNGRYYVRVVGAASFDEIWNPDSDIEFPMANNAGRWKEKDVTDAGFLELVRFGVKPALDPAILDSLPEIDETIRVDIPGVGSGFRRYLHDRYNYDDATGAQTDGMVWPFLTGERGHYELEKALESGLRIPEVDAAVAPYIQAMERMATPTYLLPEQVWDYGARAGSPTGSATPLGWTHGEYIKLLRSRNDRAVFDRVAPAAIAGLRR